MTTKEIIESIDFNLWCGNDEIPTIQEDLILIKSALEKQIPKKIVKHDKCPACNSSQSTTWYYAGSSYCEFCGQALDWSEVEE